MRIFLLYLLIITTMSRPVNQVGILIHGTWAATANWHKPGHQFFEILKSSLNAKQIKLINFNWTGILSYEKRQMAGVELAALINSYPTTTKFILVTHSHGSNVGIVASQLITQPAKITAFYALGTPIDTEHYLPNMHTIVNFYNIFSFGDLYQTALGMHQRILPTTDGIYNINIEINHQKPQHEELHCVAIAKWLPQITHYLKTVPSDSQIFAKFYDHLAPQFYLDTAFTQKMTRDLLLHKLICLHALGNYSDQRLSKIFNFSFS